MGCCGLKLLVVCQYYHPEPFRVTDLCETLVSRGHDVTVLTGIPNYPEGVVPQEYRGGKRREETINGVKVIRSFQFARGQGTLRRMLNYFSFSRFAKAKVRRLPGDFDAVFVNQLSPVMMAEPAIKYARRHGKPLLLYCLDLWPASLVAGGVGESSPIYKLFLKISRRIYSSADRVLVTSQSFIDYFGGELGISGSLPGYLPQYAEEMFAQQTAQPVSTNFKYNFVFAGNIGDVQSVDTIIKAAAIVRERTDVGFHIVGEGSALEECRALAQNLELENVVFYGRRPVDEMPSFYAMADALLCTLRNRPVLAATLPGKVQSYMAAGKPVIGSIGGEAERIINQSGCGLCCPPENPELLAETLIRFLESGRAQEMGAAGKQYYINNFSKERFFATLEDELKELTNV